MKLSASAIPAMPILSDYTTSDESPLLQQRTRPDASSPSKKRKLLKPTDATGESVVPPTNASQTTNKYNLRYEPPRPGMTEDEIAQWRRDQRKSRNRASAAASRRKIRDRIEELESEVDSYKTLYAAAMERITALESAQTAPLPFSIRPEVSSRAQSNSITPPSTPPHRSRQEHASLFQELPPLDLNLDFAPFPKRQKNQNTKKQHVIEIPSLSAA